MSAYKEVKENITNALRAELTYYADDNDLVSAMDYEAILEFIKWLESQPASNGRELQ